MKIRLNPLSNFHFILFWKNKKAKSWAFYLWVFFEAKPVCQGCTFEDDDQVVHALFGAYWYGFSRELCLYIFGHEIVLTFDKVKRRI